MSECCCSPKVVLYSAEIRTVSCAEGRTGAQESGFCVQLGFVFSWLWIKQSPLCSLRAVSKARMSLCSLGICELQGAFLGVMGRLGGFWGGLGFGVFFWSLNTLIYLVFRRFSILVFKLTWYLYYILYFSDVYSTDFPACFNHGGISLLVLLWRRLDKWVLTKCLIKIPD